MDVHDRTKRMLLFPALIIGISVILWKIKEMCRLPERIAKRFGWNIKNVENWIEYIIIFVSFLLAMIVSLILYVYVGFDIMRF